MREGYRKNGKKKDKSISNVCWSYIIFLFIPIAGVGIFHEIDIPFYIEYELGLIDDSF